MVLAYRMALESENMEVEGVEAMEFLDFALGFGVSSVPHTTINNGTVNIVGAVGEDKMVEEIRKVIL